MNRDYHWISELVQLLDEESCRKVRDNDRERLLRRYAPAGNPFPPIKATQPSCCVKPGERNTKVAPDEAQQRQGG